MFETFNKALLGNFAWKFLSKSYFVFDFFWAHYLPLLHRNYISYVFFFSMARLERVISNFET